MTAFEKLKKQTLDTDVWQGMAMYHNQPKDHEVHLCTATISETYNGSIQISIWFDKPNDKFTDGLKQVVRKTNVVEESNRFKVILEPEENMLCFFWIDKKYF